MARRTFPKDPETRLKILLNVIKRPENVILLSFALRGLQPWAGDSASDKSFEAGSRYLEDKIKELLGIEVSTNRLLKSSLFFAGFVDKFQYSPPNAGAILSNAHAETNRYSPLHNIGPSMPTLIWRLTAEGRTYGVQGSDLTIRFSLDHGFPVQKVFDDKSYNIRDTDPFYRIEILRTLSGLPDGGIEKGPFVEQLHNSSNNSRVTKFEEFMDKRNADLAVLEAYGLIESPALRVTERGRAVYAGYVLKLFDIVRTRCSPRDLTDVSDALQIRGSAQEFVGLSGFLGQPAYP